VTSARHGGKNSHHDANDFSGVPAAPVAAPHNAEATSIRQTAYDFLASRFGGKPKGAYVLIWRWRGRKSYWFTDLGEAATLVEQLQNEDVYVGVALSPNGFGPHKRCRVEHTAGIAALWTDLDIASNAHKKLNLPRSVEEALSLIPPTLPPSQIVHTGHGVQAWWIFREPWLFRDGVDRSYAADLAHRFNQDFRMRARMRGWDVDSVSDLARVLRVPGTTNTKVADAYCPVFILENRDRRYDRSELEETLNIAGIPPRGTGNRPRKVGGGQIAGQPWILNPNAKPPVEKFRLLLEIEPRFALSWRNNRPDFQDQSASAYDQSLATFAAQVHWSDQEIIDLLIAHRRKHGADLKLRPDYYRRTLEKARASAAQAALRDNHPEDDASCGTSSSPESGDAKGLIHG
jgi:hypothetical protein